MSLLVVGLLAAAFFVATDPRWGLVRAERAQVPVDAVHDATTGTYVGLAGSAVVVLLGLWLLTKRTA